MKKTPWFTSPPVRIGVYETEPFMPEGRRFQHWNGKFWGFYMPTISGAASFSESRSEDQHPTWRGLTTKEGK